MAFCLAAAPFLAPALPANQKNHSHHHRNHLVCAMSYHEEGGGVWRQKVLSESMHDLLTGVWLAGGLLAVMSVALRNR